MANRGLPRRSPLLAKRSHESHIDDVVTFGGATQNP
jgi:hypothetical protein